MAEKMKALERENRELRQANEILRKASGVFCDGGARPPVEVMVGFIDAHRDAANGPLDEPNKAFGPLYAGIRDYADEEGFAPYVSILRTCILDHWPVAPGEVVLGEVVTERRLHSLVTASRETGVGPSIIEQFLVEVGALPERDGRPPNRRLFDARANAALLAELPTLVGPIAMREAMGATRQELVALEEEEILVPRTRVPKVKNPWRASDGTALVTELQAHGVPVSEEDAGWGSLLRARKRSGVRLADMIAAIREGRIPTGQREGVSGFHGIVVRKRDVDGLQRETKTALSHSQGDDPCLVSAAAFGRSIGLRDHGGFLAMIQAGHVPARQAQNTKTRRLQYWLRAEDIESLHRRFVTLTTLSEESGLHRNTIRGLLVASRVSRFAPDGEDFGPVYLRNEATKAVRAAG
jgi:hypothetical protein